MSLLYPRTLLPQFLFSLFAREGKFKTCWIKTRDGNFQSDLLSPVWWPKLTTISSVQQPFCPSKSQGTGRGTPSKTWPCLASMLLQRGQAGHPWCCPRSAGRTTETRVYCCPRLNEFDHSFCWICKKKIQKTERKSYISKTPSLFFPTPFVPP